MILLVGERANLGRSWSPRLRPDDDVPLRLRLGAFTTSQSRANLLRAGLGWDAACNLLWPSLSSAWDSQLARRVASNLLDDDRFTAYLLAGRRVAIAFGLSGLAIPSAARAADRPVLVLPHPSGLNRLWNDPQVVSRVRRLYAEMLQELPSADPGLETTPAPHWAK